MISTIRLRQDIANIASDENLDNMVEVCLRIINLIDDLNERVTRLEKDLDAVHIPQSKP